MGGFKKHKGKNQQKSIFLKFFFANVSGKYSTLFIAKRPEEDQLLRLPEMYKVRELLGQDFSGFFRHNL